VPWYNCPGRSRLHGGGTNLDILTQEHQPRLVALGTAIRLVTTRGVMLIGVFYSLTSRVVRIAIELTLSAMVDAVVATILGWSTTRSLLKMVPTEPLLTMFRLWQFYCPLGVTALTHIISWRIVTACISRAPLSTLSLPAWPYRDDHRGVADSQCTQIQSTTVVLFTIAILTSGSADLQVDLGQQLVAF